MALYDYKEDEEPKSKINKFDKIVLFLVTINCIYIYFTDNNTNPILFLILLLTLYFLIKMRKKIIVYIKQKRKISVLQENFLHGYLIIDSNIWMEPKYDDFFETLKQACKNSNYKMELLGVQFDEIVNIKKRTDYGKGKNKRARIAISRIENFQNEGILNISKITLDSKSYAYADPYIVKIIIEKAKNGHKCIFLSEDKELKVRVRQFLTNKIEDKNWEIIDMDKF